MALSEAALAFYRDYEARYQPMQGAAAAAEELIGEALRDLPVEIHVITARAKRPGSLLKKLREKEYSDPAGELRDQIAVRVITYYDDHIHTIVTRLTERFELRPGESVDLADRLPLEAFGYRSHHLIVRAELDELAGSQAQALRGLWFEIQVRSVVAHAWDEIEHETVYKSGAKLPDPLVERFAQVSGTLKSVDEEFVRLREECDALVTGYAQAYSEGKDLDEHLDSLRLMAAFETLRPEGRSFRIAKQGARRWPRTSRRRVSRH
jgi:ppGpp synthetase/RelA/SpoT-type nucleotidyltranferase